MAHKQSYVTVMLNKRRKNKAGVPLFWTTL